MRNFGSYQKSWGKTVDLRFDNTDMLFIGPAWCHVPQTVDHMELYGAMSGEVNPDHYMQCLKRLANKCESTSAPLIVNTMGWTQGKLFKLLIIQDNFFSEF